MNELTMLQTMVKLQDEFNTIIDKNWKSNRTVKDFKLASWMEAAELLDHIGWKWWSYTHTNIEQAKLEVVDIYHFIISGLILTGDSNYEYVVSRLMMYEEGFDLYKDTTTFKDAVVQFVGSLTTNDSDIGNHTLSLLTVLRDLVGLNIKELYMTYVSKNVLNIFRQRNGYKEGTYIKTWSGKEDNEHLQDAVNQYAGKEDSPTYPDYLMEYLEKSYKAA